ncbi:N-acetylglucosamine-6-phosphate deacetylase [Symbiobacterium terraclitae]|uniref:N-acetylglucosamine-6-phosphate deacetylase n=1 Tax=Symbiobacterium terraclitae TaxID=557451 RepID=UPI0035B514B9
MKRWLKGALILPDRVVPNGLLACEDGKISGVWDLEADAGAPAVPDGAEVVERGYIAPGYIDIHVHGGGGGDFMDADPEAVVAITTCHARHGTTGLLATTLTAPEEELIRAFRAVKAAPRRGAQILGFHVEGPFINMQHKGAQNPAYVRPASVAEIDRWLAEGRPDDRWHVTLAPEIEGALEAIRHLAGRGAVVSAGHTDCTYDQLRAGVEAGVSHVTHLFNAMRGLHHREPGTVGGALSLPGVTVELIADGVHVHPASMQVAVRARGAANVLLVTDAMRAAGLGDGEFTLGGLPVTVKDGAARLHSGALAGSVLTMERGVQNLVHMVGLDLPTAVAMASLHPARRLGLEARKGSLAVGKDADLLILDDKLEVMTTIIGGEVFYDAR